MIAGMRWWVVMMVVASAGACTGDDGGGSDSNGTSSPSTAGTAASADDSASGADASADDASADGGANACVEMGGVCDCAGSCQDGWTWEMSLDASCPQPGPDAGACGMGCCLPPDGSSSSSGSGTDSASSESADTAGPQYCECEVSDALPPCPDAANCSGQEGEQCCDARGRLNECGANDIGVVWLRVFC